MGYTHYWDIHDNAEWREVLPLIVEDAKRIIDAADVLVCLDYDTDNKKPPRLDKESGIRLAGKNKSCEPLVMEPDDAGFQFCKTMLREYDIVVATIVLRTKVRAGDAVSIFSDGKWQDDYEWGRSRLLSKTLWPDETEMLECPLSF